MVWARVALVRASSLVTVLWSCSHHREGKFGDGCWWMQCEPKPLSSLVWGTLPVPLPYTVFLAGLGKAWCVCTHGSCRGPPLWKILKLEDVTCGKLLSTAGSGGLDSRQSCYCAHGRDDGCR